MPLDRKSDVGIPKIEAIKEMALNSFFFYRFTSKISRKCYGGQNFQPSIRLTAVGAEVQALQTFKNSNRWMNLMKEDISNAKCMVFYKKNGCTVDECWKASYDEKNKKEKWPCEMAEIQKCISSECDTAGVKKSNEGIQYL